MPLPCSGSVTVYSDRLILNLSFFYRLVRNPNTIQYYTEYAYTVNLGFGMFADYNRRNKRNSSYLSVERVLFAGVRIPGTIDCRLKFEHALLDLAQW